MQSRAPLCLFGPRLSSSSSLPSSSSFLQTPTIAQMSIPCVIGLVFLAKEGTIPVMSSIVHSHTVTRHLLHIQVWKTTIVAFVNAAIHGGSKNVCILSCSQHSFAAN